MSCLQLLPSVMHGTWLLTDVMTLQACYMPMAFTTMAQKLFPGSRTTTSCSPGTIAAPIAGRKHQEQIPTFWMNSQLDRRANCSNSTKSTLAEQIGSQSNTSRSEEHTS